MLKKVSTLVVFIALTVSASERERTPRPSIPLGRFIMPTFETIDDIEKHAKELENAKGKTTEEEYFRLAGLATAYIKLRDNHRGRGQGTIYRKYDELHNQYNSQALELNERMLVKEQIECLNGHIKGIHQNKQSKPMQCWISSEPFYAQIARLSETTFPDIHQQALAKLKHIESLKFQNEVINLIRECRLHNNKAGMITNYKTLRKTVANQQHIDDIDTRIETLEQELIIDQKKYDFEIAVSAMLNDNSAPLQCYQNLITYCQKRSQDPDLKTLCDKKQQFFQDAADAEQRHLDRLAKLKAELARTPEDIVAAVRVACKVTPYAVLLKSTNDQVETVKTGAFATQAEKQVALANALYARCNFYNQYPVTHAADARADKKRYEEIVDLLLADNCPDPIFNTLNPAINPLVIK